MNKKSLLRLSAILFVLIGMLAFSYCTRPYGGLSLDNQDVPVLRADGVPAPPFPWPWGLSPSTDARLG
jgi:hypothetical protein